MQVSDLPTLNAVLNSTSAVLLVAALVAVRCRRLVLHRNLMLSAITVSAFFLVSYLTYHYLHGHQVYRGTARGLYLLILGTHTILAISVLPLVLITSWLALREKSAALTGPDVKARFASHRMIARWTFPIWLYVSVTGVVVYWMLYCR